MPVAWCQKIRLWWPPSLWACCILLASSIPGEDIPPQEIGYLDKVVHFGIYGVLGVLLARTSLSSRSAFALAALFGILDELYQHLTPHRTPDPLDWVTDITGAFAGIFITRWLLKRHASQNP
jgi:VanZ family protein